MCGFKAYGINRSRADRMPSAQLCKNIVELRRRTPRQKVIESTEDAEFRSATLTLAAPKSKEPDDGFSEERLGRPCLVVMYRSL
ncbi:hypothetical protein CU102_22565 [Phyllobacterium brassicacearum]|uniref:Uncharacterized protein n=1 Tax=Phyllobacterium brassicacearum TaxID=314235 RepID=A0A2P7BCW8_9HYPH|nr:hypothetical protein CU102_22565 [Phyllobacterium brassicacearum]